MNSAGGLCHRPPWVPKAWPPEQLPARPSRMPDLRIESVEKPLGSTSLELLATPPEVSRVSFTLHASGMDYDLQDAMPVRLLLLAAFHKPQGSACHLSKLGQGALAYTVLAQISKMLWFPARAEYEDRSLSIHFGGVASIEWVMSSHHKPDSSVDDYDDVDDYYETHSILTPSIFTDDSSDDDFVKPAGLWLSTNKETARLLSPGHILRRVPHTVTVLLKHRLPQIFGMGLVCVWVDGVRCLPSSHGLRYYEPLPWQTSKARVEWKGTCGKLSSLKMYGYSHMEAYSDVFSTRLKPSDLAHFEKIWSFFRSHQTQPENATHHSMLPDDPFTATGQWHFDATPQVQTDLFSHIQWLFDRQIYCYISEIFATCFPFVEGFRVRTLESLESSQAVMDGIVMNLPQGRVGGDPGVFMQLRAAVLSTLYPHLDHLDAYIYLSSGKSAADGLQHMHYRLVWPQIVVDKRIAKIVRISTLKSFEKEASKDASTVNRLQKRLLQLHPTNSWDSVLEYRKNALHLPFNDCTSWVISDASEKNKVAAGLISKRKAFKTVLREGRPAVAVGMLRFDVASDPISGTRQILSAKWMMHRGSLPTAEWIRRGVCRCSPESLPARTELRWPQ